VSKKSLQIYTVKYILSVLPVSNASNTVCTVVTVLPTFLHIGGTFVDQEGKVRSPVHEEKAFTSDQLHEKICRRLVGKCSFLLLAVQPAILGESRHVVKYRVKYLRCLADRC